MTTPEVDQELERLFSVGRAATAPDAGARDRIRASLAPRLAASAQPHPLAWGRRAWLGIGVALLGIGAVALWFARAPQVDQGALPVAAPARVAAPANSALEPAPSAAPTPPAPPALVDAPPALRTMPPAAAKPAPPTASSTRNADPAEELPLVRAMQQALRSGNPSQALVLAGEHARRFPHGILVEEREGVRAVAQCQLAAPGARVSILDTFTRRFATSPYAARVKAACQ